MKIFPAHDICISSLTIIVDDVHHATHILLRALYDGVRHWPHIEYAIGEFQPVHAKQTGAMRNWADASMAGIVHRCNDGGWARQLVTIDEPS